jgi:DNA-binding MarR family transcriptional regulator
MAEIPEPQTSQRLQSLAEFRYTLRKFLNFSEQAALQANLQPQQHQLMLQIAGAPEGVETTISWVAERLGLRHHSVVELSKRCAEAGLVQRLQTNPDHRFVILRLTAGGEQALASLSDAHARELNELAPQLVRALNRVRKSSLGQYTQNLEIK